MSALAASHGTALLFAAVVALLLLAGGAGALLKWRLAHGQPSVLIDELNARVKAWWLMVAVIGGAFALGKGGVIALFLLLSFYALREFMSLAYTRRGDHNAIAVAFYIALPVQYFLVAIEWYGLYSVFIPVYAFLVLPILSAVGGDAQRFLERSAKIQWGLMICVYCISLVPALLTLNIPGFEERNLLLIAFLVLVVQGSNVLQFVCNHLVGRHPLAPVLAPGSTWEGLLAGVASASALGAALWWATPFRPWQAALLALAISLTGFFGELVMAAIKRDRGVKDWGNTGPGGGMLDRLGAVIFAAPVFFHTLRYWWVP